MSVKNKELSYIRSVNNLDLAERQSKFYIK